MLCTREKNECDCSTMSTNSKVDYVKNYREDFTNICVSNIQAINGSDEELFMAQNFAEMVRRGAKYFITGEIFNKEKREAWRSLTAEFPPELHDKWLHINIDGLAKTSKRWQVEWGRESIRSSTLPSYLSRFAEVVHTLHPNLISIEWSSLYSDVNCKQQPFHEDDALLSSVDGKSESDFGLFRVDNFVYVYNPWNPANLG